MKEKHDLINLIEDIQGYIPMYGAMTSEVYGEWLNRKEVIKVIKKYLRKEEKK